MEAIGNSEWGVWGEDRLSLRVADQMRTMLES
jgi:hypothetical protein